MSKFISYINEASKNFEITKVLRIGDTFIILYKAKLYGGVETHDRTSAKNITELLDKLDNWDVSPKDVPFGNSNLLTLQDYIDSISSHSDAVRDRVIKDCQPILRALKGSKELIVRGSSKSINGIEEVIPRTDRRPLSTNVLISDAVDKALYKRFNWYPRSEGVFAYYGDRDSAYSYGAVYYMLPIGKYEYVWSKKYTDLYLYLAPRDFKITPIYIAEHLIPNITRGKIVEVMKMLDLEPSTEQPWQASQENNRKIASIPLDKLINTCAEYVAKQYTNKELKSSSGFELSFKCDKYYLIEKEYKSVLMDLI